MTTENNAAPSGLTSSERALAKNVAMHCDEAHVLAGNEVCSSLMQKAAETIRALLAAAPKTAEQAPVADAVPAGWKAVPIDLTEEMIMAGNAATRDQLEPAMHAWDAMLAAAPQPPVVDAARGELIAGLRAEQLHVAASRDMCDPDDELPRWDRLQRVIDYLDTPTQQPPRASEAREAVVDESQVIDAIRKACGAYRTNDTYSYEDVWNSIEAFYASGRRAQQAVALTTERKRRIAQIVHTDCTLIPGSTFYNAAEMAITATLAALQSHSEGSQQ